MNRRQQLITQCRQALVILESQKTECAEIQIGDLNFAFHDLNQIVGPGGELYPAHCHTPAQAAKAAGLPSLKTMTDISGVGASTLDGWFANKRQLFDMVLESAVNRYRRENP